MLRTAEIFWSITLESDAGRMRDADSNVDHCVTVWSHCSDLALNGGYTLVTAAE